MNDESRKSASKFLSLVLRHQPDVAGVTLDAGGWTPIEALLEGCAAAGRPLSRPELDEVVATNPKQRFAISEDGTQIRANQGHSVEVSLGLEAAEPPATLFHGTVAKSLPAILAGGLQRMQRHHVHLSVDEATAVNVGGRRGRALILRVDALAMRRAGHEFYCSTNGVWLTDVVPPEFISVDES